MKPGDIRRHRNRTPFRPFVIELTSGTRLKVSHPDILMVGKHLAAMRRADDELIMFTPEEVCAIFDVKNGARRNGR